MKDSIKLVASTIKLGSIPIGLHKVAVLPNVKPGTVVIVCYNPENPKKVYLRDNVGHLTA